MVDRKRIIYHLIRANIARRNSADYFMLAGEVNDSYAREKCMSLFRGWGNVAVEEEKKARQLVKTGDNIITVIENYNGQSLNQLFLEAEK